MPYEHIKLHLTNAASPERAKRTKQFFKTGKGQYAEADQFIGIAIPDLRRFAQQFENISPAVLQILLASPIHEERLLALLILIKQYQGNPQATYQLYIDNLQHVNNWDLVDTSAHLIIGAHLLTQENQDILIELAHAPCLWHRRIAIVATWQFIRHHQFEWTIKIATILLHDHQDLIHKAVGWMLREMGKRNLAPLTTFLNQHAHHMPRTMLRYAIEKLPENRRQAYLSATQLEK